MPKEIDITGRRYMRLTVTAFAGRKIIGSQSKRMWRCLCDCGNIRTIPYSALASGTTRSCGCLLREKITKHGQYKTPIYKIWHSMIERCRNLNNQSYHLYGARKISVCDRWQKFENFLLDMGGRPDGCSLDRIDNNGQYSPGNCRWATARQQASNRRTNKFLTYRGITLSISGWARKIGVSKSTLLHRVKSGWPLDKALTLPPSRERNQKIIRCVLFAEQ